MARFQPHADVRDSLDPTTTWNLGNIDDFHLSKAHGNPWQRCLDLILREDKSKCQAWNDEVQTLLIFAGLFSAVVTACVIQSYQDIQQIPVNQAIAYLLISYSTQANQTSTEESTAALSNLALNLANQGSYACSIRVNIVWFLSLILSLTTVLVGIIALQWIREYNHYSDSSSAKRKLAVRNMRTVGLEKWKVPEIIAGLPLILQTAVILFFVGLIDFLLNISLVVAVPAIVVISIALLFIFGTIILPACQCFWAANADVPDGQISQCPYKSPQAWTFIRTLSQPLLRWHLIPIVLFPPAMVIAAVLPFGFLVAKILGFRTTSLSSFSHFFKRLMKNMMKAPLKNWDAFDSIFLKRRQQVVSKASHSANRSTFDSASTGALFDYDASMSIAHLLNEHIYDPSLARAAYDCFRQLPSSIITDEFLTPKDISRVWETHEQSLRISDIIPLAWSPSKTTLRKYENEILFLEHLFHSLEINSLPVLRARQLELFVRTLGHIFTDEQYAASQAADGGNNLNRAATVLAQTLRHTHLKGLLVPSSLADAKTIHMLPDDAFRGVNKQLLAIFEAFITKIINSAGRDVSMFCQREDLLASFVQLVCVVTQATLFPNPDSPQPTLVGADRFVVALIKIVALLADNIYPSMPLATRILFSTGLTFASHLSAEDLHVWRGRSPEFVDTLMKLIQSLRFCEESQAFQARFRVQDKYRARLWNLRTFSVTYTLPGKELEASVIGSASDSASGAKVTSSHSFSSEKE